MHPAQHFSQAVFNRLESGIRALGDEPNLARRTARKTQLRHAIVALTAAEAHSESQSLILLLQVDRGGLG